MTEQHAIKPLPQTATAIKRRGILAAAGAVVVGILAKETGQHVQATSGTGGQGALVLASNNLDNTANTATRPTYLFNTAGGTPVVSAFYSGDAFLAASVSGAGVIGRSSSGVGVDGTSDTFHGIIGQTGTGSGHAGIAGFGAGSGTFGILGDGFGGSSTTGGAVGVQGQNAQYGVVGTVNNADNSIAVWGNNTSTGASGYGVQGTSTLSHGVVGKSGTSQGASGVVAVGTAPGAVGFQGVAQGGATYAGYFFGTVSIQNRVSDGKGGNLGVTGAVTQGGVPTSQGKVQGMYTMSSPEGWAEDFGTGKLTGGKAEITLEPEFATRVHTDDYHVFITEHDEHNALLVTGRTAHSFVVAADGTWAKARGKDAGQVSGTFSYRVVAKRKDIEAGRMPVWEAPTEPNVPASPALPPVTITPQPAPPARPNGGVPASGSAQGNGQATVQPVPPPRP